MQLKQLNFLEVLFACSVIVGYKRKKGSLAAIRTAFFVISLQSNNLVIHSAVKTFHENAASPGDSAERPSPAEGARPHLITCTVEHDSICLPLRHLAEEQMAGEWPQGPCGQLLTQVSLVGDLPHGVYPSRLSVGA